VVLKGPVTQISSCQEIYHSLFGGPMLARGGSGDLLAGMIGAQLARTPDDILGATCRGVVWHGLAADALGRKLGSTAVRTTQLLDFLPGVLKMR
jgi:ADP-dependent NAD(P)H-hydrate dehydratase / NAD(P)H-hydrate epimerase